MTGNNRKARKESAAQAQASQESSQESSLEHPLLDEDLVGALEIVSKRLRATSGGAGAKQSLAILGEPDIREMLQQLHDVLHNVLSTNSTMSLKLDVLSSKNEELSDRVISLEESTRVHELKSEDISDRVISLEKSSRVHADTADHHHQRSLLGKFVISSPSPNFISQRGDLEAKGVELAQYTCQLINSKFGFSATTSDIFSCHHSKKGIIFRFSNLSPNSIYSQTISAIKQGHGRENKDIYVLMPSL